MKRYICRSFIPGCITLFCTILLASSCDRNDSIDNNVRKAQIKVEFDYSRAGIPLSGTTIVFYPKEGTNEHERLTISTHNSSTLVNLAPGEYSVLVINETFGDFNNIGFHDTERYNQIEAYAMPIDNSTKVHNFPLSYCPDILVVDTLSSFIVTPEMVEQTWTRLQSTTEQNVAATKVFTLQRCVSRVNTKIHIGNIQYIRNATYTISGLSQAHILSSRRNSLVGVAHGAENIKMSFNQGSKTNGTVNGSFNSFGLQPDDKGTYRLIFEALLIDGTTTVRKEFDITDNIKIDKDENGLIIDIELGSIEKPLIIIPEVKPEPGTSPFEPDVDDWEEGNTVDVPL